MSAIGTQDIQRAYDAAVAGDVEPLVDMLGPNLEWRGIERGLWLWRRAPS